MNSSNATQATGAAVGCTLAVAMIAGAVSLPSANESEAQSVAAAIQERYPSVGEVTPAPPSPIGMSDGGESLIVMIPASDKALGDDVAQYLVTEADELQLQYIIWDRQFMERDRPVVPMVDRGTPTQNHTDHIHVRVGGEVR